MESPLLSRLFAVFLLCIPAVRIAEADRLWGAGFPQNEKASDRYEARIPLKGPGGATFTAYMARRCVEPDSTGSCDDSDMHDAPIWIVRDTDKAVVFSDAFYSDYGAPTRVVADADADGIPDLVISSTSGGSWASRTSVLAVLMGSGTIASYQEDSGRAGRVAAKFDGAAKSKKEKALRAFLKRCAAGSCM